MGYQIPEQPLLIYPSLVARYGLEEALLLGIYHQLGQRMGLRLRSGQREIKLDTASWQQLVSFWDADKLAQVTQSLVEQQAIDATLSRTLVKITLFSEAGSEAEPNPAGSRPVQPESVVPEPVLPETAPEPDVEVVSRLSVVDQPPPMMDVPPLGVAEPPPASQPPTTRTPPVRQSVPASRTPAPAFGGSTGWRRHKDELQVLFEEHEVRNQQLHSMFLGWQPSASFFELLSQHAIPDTFARDCLDEFVLYWVNRDRREANWDQKFLGWVKKDWVKKQTREGREQRIAQQEASFKHENARRDTRENRKRVTQAIMDIRDTDW